MYHSYFTLLEAQISHVHRAKANILAEVRECAVRQYPSIVFQFGVQRLQKLDGWLLQVGYEKNSG